MKSFKSLIKGKFIKRYKRFFVDVLINKKIVTAHCANTGSMKGLLDEGNEVYLLQNNDPKRKLKYSLEIIKSRKNLIGVNTHFANKIVHHALENNLIKYQQEISKKNKDLLDFRNKSKNDFALNLRSTLEKYAKENKISLILRKEQLLVGENSLDITKEILELFNKI